MRAAASVNTASKYKHAPNNNNNNNNNNADRHSKQRLERVVAELTAEPADGAPPPEPPDIEDLMRAGRASGTCAYFLSRDLVPSSDIVFMVRACGGWARAWACVFWGGGAARAAMCGPPLWLKHRPPPPPLNAPPPTPAPPQPNAPPNPPPHTRPHSKPYNYLLDASVRARLEGIAWEGSVVIFDEAHNVTVRAAEGGVLFF